MLSETEMTDAGEEISSIEALLDGSSEPPTDEVDLTEPETIDASDDVIVKAEDIPEMSEHDLVEALTMSAPERTERRARSEAFKDRVAHERAKELLGDDFDEIVAAMDEAPKKVGEKVYNALCFIAQRGKLSNFTAIALDALWSGEPVKSTDLVALYKTGYSEGTARSQAQQMMTALPILKLARRDGDTLTPISGRMENEMLKARLTEPEVKGRPPRKESTPKSDDEALLADASEPETVEDPTPEDTDLLASADELTAEEAPVPDVIDHEAAEDADLLSGE